MYPDFKENSDRVSDLIYTAYQTKPAEKWITEFRTIVYSFFSAHRRTFPWRESFKPYEIMVSEIMLQQTQTERVVAKYREFMSSFPTIRELASASLLDILKVWQGLGYNRRARFLHQAAQMVCKEYNAILPETEEELVKLPGIGKATASAICAYAYDLPVVYIETNIRALFIHFFFQDRTDVQDKEILPLVEATLDRKNPRKWYSALMDLGTEIKKRYPNPSRRSKHHTTQSKFKGSRRELRGQVIRNLVANPLGLAIDEFEISETFDYELLASVLDTLCQEKMITCTNGIHRLN